MPYEWRRMASPPTTGSTSTFHQLLSPKNQSHPVPKPQGSTANCFVTSPGSSISYSSLDLELIGRAHGRSYDGPLPPLPPEERSAVHATSCVPPDSYFTAQQRTSEAGPESEKSRMTKRRPLGGLFGRRFASSPGVPTSQALPSPEEEFPKPRRVRQPEVECRQRIEDQPTHAQEALVLPSPQSMPPHFTLPSKHIPVISPLVPSVVGAQTFRPEIKLSVPPTRPQLQRSQTCPIAEQRDKSPMPPPKDTGVNPDFATLQLNEGSLLQVEIPSVQLERYSVMFENVLKRPSSSSLLARRHEHFKDLKSREENEQQVQSTIKNQEISSSPRPRSTSPSRSPSALLFSPMSSSENPLSAPTRRTGGSSPQRSLTSPHLAHVRRSGRLTESQQPEKVASDRALVAVKDPINTKSALRSQEPHKDSHLLGHSRSSTDANFHTDAESQAVGVTSKHLVMRQDLPKRTSSVKGARPLRASRSGLLPAISPHIPASMQSTRGRIWDTHDVREKRSASVANVQTSSLKSRKQCESSLPEYKPAIPLRIPKNGCSSRAQQHPVSATGLSKHIGGSDQALIAVGREYRGGSDPIMAPLASHPPTPYKESRPTSKAGTRTRTIGDHSPTIIVPEAPLSAPPVPSEVKRPTTKSTQPVYPKPTIFSPPPSTTNVTDTTQPPVPILLQSPEELKNAAEISIARQIAISHRQRELLAPLAPKFARQPMQPILVDVEGGAPVTRKSHHLVLEQA